MTDAKHEAPAEGAGEVRSADHLFDLIAGSLFDHPHKAAPVGAVRLLADDLWSMIRARSSAPEARDGEAWDKAVDAMRGAIEWDKARGYRMPYRVRDPLYAAIDARPTHPAAPSADKLRIAVEALGEIKGLLSYASQDAVTEAVAQGNRNLAWHKAEEALAALKAEAR